MPNDKDRIVGQLGLGNPAAEPQTLQQRKTDVAGRERTDDARHGPARWRDGTTIPRQQAEPTGGVHPMPEPGGPGAEFRPSLLGVLHGFRRNELRHGDGRLS